MTNECFRSVKNLRIIYYISRLSYFYFIILKNHEKDNHSIGGCVCINRSF